MRFGLGDSGAAVTSGGTSVVVGRRTGVDSGDESGFSAKRRKR